MPFAQLRRAKIRIPTRSLLVLNLSFASILLILCFAVCLGQPIHRIAWLAIVVPAGIIALYIWSFRKRFTLRTLFPILAIVILAIALVSGRAIHKNEFISYSSEAWVYSSLGEYLERNSIFVSEVSHLPPVEQFGSHLRRKRFAAASLLAFLGQLSGGNSASGLTWLVVLASVNIFTGFTVWCRLLRCPAPLSLSAGFFALVCSWTRDAIAVGNLDNLIFMAILPNFLFRYLLFPRKPNKTSSLLGLAVTAATLFYVYPEGLAITGAIFLPFFSWKLFNDLVRRRQVRAYILLIFSTFLLVAPYVGIFSVFVIRQFAVTRQVLRPGEHIFPGLFSSNALSAIFGLAQEFGATTFSFFNSVLPALLIILITIAAFTWWRTHRSLFCCLASLSFFAVWQGIFEKYDYGLFKTLFVGSAYWIPAMFVGLSVLSGRLFARRAPIAQTSLAVLLSAWAYWEKSQDFNVLPFNCQIPMGPYQQLTQIRNVVGKGGVTLKMHTDLNQEWAVLFLRDIPLNIPTPRSYLAKPHLAALMAQAAYAPDEPHFVVTDSKSSEAIWHNQVFWLVPRERYLSFEDINGPNQVENVRGKPFVWIENKPTTFTVESAAQQLIRFYASQGWPGPSLPNHPTRTIVVKTDHFRQSIVATNSFSVELPVDSGKNRIEVWCEDKPSTPVKDDPRVLLFGLLDFQCESIGNIN